MSNNEENIESFDPNNVYNEGFTEVKPQEKIITEEEVEKPVKIEILNERK